MLKILKYEWKLGLRTVKPTLIAGFIISVLFGLLVGLLGTPDYGIDKLVFSGNDRTEIVIMICSIVWLAVWFALFVLTVDVILKALSTRMFAPEGYLAHTLPVHSWELLGGKALGVWLFGVFMTVMAAAGFWVLLLVALAVSGAMGEFFRFLWSALPQLTSQHWASLGQAAVWFAKAYLIFLVSSLIGIVNLQFVCIAGRQFGKHHLAGGIIVLVVLLNIEGRLASATHLGSLVSVLMGTVCFIGSNWLLKNRLSL